MSINLTIKQAILLIRVLEGSCNLVDRSDMNIFGISRQARQDLYDEILEQQSNEFLDLEKKCNRGPFRNFDEPYHERKNGEE